jgi:hypothetical protein
MHKIEIPQRNIVKEFPSEIQEMDQYQFINFIDLVLMYTSGTINIAQFKVLMIKNLLNIRYNLRYSTLSAVEKEEIAGNIIILSELCESFFEDIIQDGKTVKSFKLNFIKNFIPVICGRYYGPKDALQDISFCEYRLAHSHFVSYIESHDEQDLNNLIAVLYRPRKRFLWLRKYLRSYNGQPRISITSKSNPVHLEQRARRIGKLSIAVRYGIFLYFSGSEHFLVNGKPTVDGKEIDFSILYEKPEDASDSPDIGLIGILYSLAETKVFGSIAETDDQDLYDIMIRLYQVVRQSKAMEAKFKSHGNGK